VEIALWEYRRHACALWKEGSRLFTDPTGDFADQVNQTAIEQAQTR
jgi:hypothetical protein